MPVAYDLHETLGHRWQPSVSDQVTSLRAGDRTRTGDVQLGKLAFYQLNYARRFREPQVRIELTTARLRIGCSTPELLWPSYALERTRTAMPYGTTPSRWRVYQFHHQGNPLSAVRNSQLRDFQSTGPTGLEPATSRVTVECSNQTELRPQLQSQGRIPLPHRDLYHRTGCQSALISDKIAPRGIEPLSAP